MKKQQVTRGVNQPTKSTSLSNFNFVNKVEPETTSTANSELSDPRRLKEKQW